MASGYNLLRHRAPDDAHVRRPARPVGAVPARDQARSTTRAWMRRSCTRTSTSSRRSPTSSSPAAGCAPTCPAPCWPSPARRAGAGCDIVNRIVPARIRSAARDGGRAPRDRAVGPRPPAARLPRPDGRAAGAGDRRRGPGRVARRPPGAADRRPHDVGLPGARRRPRLLRPQPGPVVGARARGVRRRRAAAPGPCDRRARAFQAVADRALGRLAARHPIGAGGMAIVPSANGPATVPAIDDYASEVVYNGLTLTALGWAADARARAAAAPAASSPTAARRRARLPFEDARFATLRAGPRVDGGQAVLPAARRPRRVRDPRAQVPRARRRAGSTSCPPRRRPPARRRARSARRCGCAPARLARPIGHGDRGPPRAGSSSTAAGWRAAAGCAST